jgi:hypothetical protein
MTIFLGDMRFWHCWNWGFRPSGMWYSVTELVVFNLTLKYASITQWRNMHQLPSDIALHPRRPRSLLFFSIAFFPSSPIWWVMVSDLGQVCRKGFKTCSYRSLNFLHNSMYTIFTCTLCTLFQHVGIGEIFFSSKSDIHVYSSFFWSYVIYVLLTACSRTV